MKIVDFSETIEACDLKVGKYRNFMTVYVSIEGHGHFLTLAKSHLHIKNKTHFSQKPLGRF